MRYFLDNSTLFIRGSFRAASTGIGGGIGAVSTLINHTVPPDWSRTSPPEKELEMVAAGGGLGKNYFGLLTAVPMRNLCVLQCDFITTFITAGIHGTDGKGYGTINIITCSVQGMSDAALLETIMVASAAKAEALQDLGRGITGTPADAIITACEGNQRHGSGGSTFTAIGKRVYGAVLHGVPEALMRYEGRVKRSRPSFFIFSRIKGDHWTEWTPENCPYYPCHFTGQRCDYCYCPLYPCGDEALGQWVESSTGGKVWNCARCTLLHEPDTADYLKRHPDASKDELVCFRNTKK
jgi:adenosylcobinamide hydrolase